MGRYSYSQPSLSPTILASGSYDDSVSKPLRSLKPGIPWTCYYGLAPVTHTSTTDLNPGRVFFGCTNHKDGGWHVFKWWDEALIEEIRALRRLWENHEELYHDFRKQGFLDAKNEGRLIVIKEEIAGLKETIEGKFAGANKWNKALLADVAWKDVVVGVIILGLISLLFLKK